LCRIRIEDRLVIHHTDVRRDEEVTDCNVLVLKPTQDVHIRRTDAQLLLSLAESRDLERVVPGLSGATGQRDLATVIRDGLTAAREDDVRLAIAWVAKDQHCGD